MDRSAGLVGAGISFRGQHHTDRRLVMPFHGDLIEPMIDYSLQHIQKVGF